MKPPPEPDAGPTSSVSYEAAIDNADLVMDYEHIPYELLPVAKRLNLRWPHFADQDVPDRIDEWRYFYSGSTKIEDSEGALSTALQNNEGTDVDALKAYWNDKVRSYVNRLPGLALDVQSALVNAGLQIFFYKKFALATMQSLYQQEQAFWWFNQPSDSDYKSKADDLNARLTVVNTTIDTSTTQIKNAQKTIEETRKALNSDLEAFASKGLVPGGYYGG